MSLSPESGYRPLDLDHPDFADLKILQDIVFTSVGGQAKFEKGLRTLFRSAIDEVIDSPRTGRFLFSQLEKTEKTYLGTKVELLVRAWLKVPRGDRLDLKIGTTEVDVKLTTSGRFSWMIPREAIEQLCILLQFDEEEFTCSVGLVRARREYLRDGVNQDKKTSLSAAGVKNIWWLVSACSYEANFWATLDGQTHELVAAASGGAQRLAVFFERCIGRPVSRDRIAAVALQDDFMKRIRRNGGARDLLAPKGIGILYSENDRALIKRLGLTLGYREFVSYRPANFEEECLLREAGKID